MLIAVAILTRHAQRNRPDADRRRDVSSAGTRGGTVPDDGRGNEARIVETLWVGNFQIKRTSEPYRYPAAGPVSTSYIEPIGGEPSPMGARGRSPPHLCRDSIGYSQIRKRKGPGYSDRYRNVPRPCRARYRSCKPARQKDGRAHDVLMRCNEAAERAATSGSLTMASPTAERHVLGVAARRTMRRENENSGRVSLGRYLAVWKCAALAAARASLIPIRGRFGAWSPHCGARMKG